jgi:hypothetical protein
MIGPAQDLRRGDILITTDGSQWTLSNVEIVREGVRVYLTDMPFPWLFARKEIVCYQRDQRA